MIELPDKFKKALGNGVRTFLYPLVRIYKDIKIDDDIFENEDIINLSTKEVSIQNTNGDYNYYKPLLLSSPTLNSKADIINNKYTISSVSLNISNANYQGQIFSDNLLDYLNSVCQVYFCANGIDSLSDSLLVYTGTVRRYNQSAEKINLVLEDLTQQKLSAKIPTSIIENDNFYKEKDIGRPFPMVYGYVDKSPVIAKSAGRDDMGELREDLTKFHIDKIGTEVRGLWEEPNANNFGNDYINSNHPLVYEGYIKSVGTLSMYEDGYLPIPQDIETKGWSFYVDGILDSSEAGYNKITGEQLGGLLYQFEQTDGSTTSASIRLLENALINVDDVQGIPTRIYRPIQKVECYTYCDNVNGNDMDSVNRIYGFDNYNTSNSTFSIENHTSNSDMYFIPFRASENINRNFYEDNWNFGDQSMWEATVCNANVNGHASGSVDENFKSDTNKGFFPVERLQNGNLNSGIFVCGKNSDGSRISGDNKSGMAYARFIFSENIGSLACSSKLIFDNEQHTWDNMTNDYGSGQQAVACASLWTGDSVPVYEGDFSTNINSLEAPFTYLPHNDVDSTGGDYELINYAEHTGTEDSQLIRMAFKELSLFNRTDYSDHINFGIEQFPKIGQTKGNDRSFVANQMYNFYLLHDAIIENPLNKEFYADVVGRTKEGFIPQEEINVTSATHYGIENILWWSIIITETDHNLSAGNTFDIYKSDGTYRGNYTVQTGYGNYIKVWAENLGDCDNGKIVLPADKPVIRTIDDIFEDILINELDYQKSINLIPIQYPWLYSFTLNEQKEAKDVFEGLFKSSTQIPAFDADGSFKLLNLHQVLDDEDVIEDIITINNEDIISYSYELTKVDDIKNSINIKYNFEYATNSFKKQTGYIIQEGEPNITTYDEMTEFNYPNDSEKHYSLDYYGLKDVDARLEVETMYIRDEDTAKKLQKRLLNWYANQHLIIKLDLPISYIHLETGDYIEFNELINGKLAFGYDYTKNANKNGQLIYKYFFLTKVNKSLDKISIEMIQVHRGEYGFYEGWDEGLIDNGENDGVGNFEIDDWQDSGAYDEEVIIDEEIVPDEPVPELEFIGWVNNNSNVQYLNPIYANIDATNIPKYALFVVGNPEIVYYGDSNAPSNSFIPVVTSSDEPFLLGQIDNSEYLNIQMVNHPQGGLNHISIGTNFNLDAEHNGITFRLSLYRESPVFEELETTLGDENIFFTHTRTDTSVRLGDYNQDGALNVLDVVNLVITITDQVSWQNDYPQMDMNDDGTLNVLDVVILVNIILQGEG